MIWIRDECSRVRTGFNFYPRKSPNVGFIFKLGRARILLRYSKISGRLDCYGWPQHDTLDKHF